MKKQHLLKTMFLLCALVVGSMNGWGGTYTLTPNQASTGSSATTYITSLTEFEYAGIEWKMNQWNPSTLQVKVNQTSAANEFRFYNTSEFPGKITQVVITFSAMTVTDASKFMFLGGTTEQSGTTGGTAGTWNETAKTLTWTPGNSDNFTYFAFYQNGKAASGTNYLASSAAIVVTFEGGDIQTCATPTFSPTEGTFPTTQNVTLSCSTPEATIRYTTDGTNPSKTSSAYSSAISVSSTTTIKAKAFKNGMASSTIASATYTIVPPSDNIAELTENTNTAAETKYVTLTNAVVTFTSGSYAYIQDASGAILYYKSGHGLTAGDVLNGTATVTYQVRNGNPQITALTGITKTSGAAPASTSVAASSWAYTFNDVLSQYFQITGATITSSDSKYYVSLGGENVQLYKVGTALGELNLTKKYTITGFPTLYNTTKELYIFAAPAEEASSDPIIAATPTSLTGFSYLSDNGPSVAKTISVSGSNLTADISLSASTNYEMCDTENGVYSNSLTLTQTAGAVAATTVYVRLKAGLTSNDYDGTITLTSTGADNVIVNLSGSVIATASLPFSWTGTSSAGSAEFDAETGVEVNLGGDFAASNAPYRLKFEGTSNYVVIYTDEKPEAVSFTAKLYNATTTDAGSKIKVQESEDGITYTDVQEFTIKGAKDATFAFTTTNAFAKNSRAVKLIMSAKDQNVGVGNIIVKPMPSSPSDPVDNHNGTITITTSNNMNGWRAFYDASQDYEVDSYTKIYVAKAKSTTEGKVELTALSATKIPAGVPVILKTTDAGHSMTLAETSGATALGDNLLAVTDGTNNVDGYRLGYGEIGGSDAVGFFKYTTTTAPAAGIVYIDKNDVNITSGARGLSISFTDDETTGVNELKAQKVDNLYFNLAGQRVTQPTKGLYIVNGKKVIVK